MDWSEWEEEYEGEPEPITRESLAKLSPTEREFMESYVCLVMGSGTGLIAN